MKFKIISFQSLQFILLSTMLLYLFSCSYPCDFSTESVIGTWESNGKTIVFHADGELEDNELIISNGSANETTIKSWSISSLQEMIIAEETEENIVYKAFVANSFDCGYMNLESHGEYFQLTQIQ